MATKNASVVAKGGLFLSIVMDGSPPGRTPTKANLDSWINGQHLPFSAVLENVGQPNSFIDYYSVGKENYFIYDLATMTLLKHIEGSVSTALSAYMAILSGTPDAGM